MRDIKSALLKLLLCGEVVGKSMKLGNSVVVINPNWVTLWGFKTGVDFESIALKDTRLADVDVCIYFPVVGDIIIILLWE